MIDILLEVLLFLIASFLILLILVQRGKGGGLAGAFGGLGGQSAFGTKAGDTFTRVTIGVAAVWILLCIATVKLLGTGSNVLDFGASGSTTVEESSGPQSPGDEGPSPSPEAPGDNPAGEK